MKPDEAKALLFKTFGHRKPPLGVMEDRRYRNLAVQTEPGLSSRHWMPGDRQTPSSRAGVWCNDCDVPCVLEPGHVARCPSCGKAGRTCRSTNGKGCVLLEGHADPREKYPFPYHESPSGSESK